MNSPKDELQSLIDDELCDRWLVVWKAKTKLPAWKAILKNESSDDERFRVALIDFREKIGKVAEINVEVWRRAMSIIMEKMRVDFQQSEITDLDKKPKGDVLFMHFHLPKEEKFRDTDVINSVEGINQRFGLKSEYFNRVGVIQVEVHIKKFLLGEKKFLEEEAKRLKEMEDEEAVTGKYSRPSKDSS